MEFKASASAGLVSSSAQYIQSSRSQGGLDVRDSEFCNDPSHDALVFEVIRADMCTLACDSVGDCVKRQQGGERGTLVGQR